MEKKDIQPRTISKRSMIAILITGALTTAFTVLYIDNLRTARFSKPLEILQQKGFDAKLRQAEEKFEQKLGKIREEERQQAAGTDSSGACNMLAQQKFQKDIEVAIQNKRRLDSIMISIVPH